MNPPPCDCQPPHGTPPTLTVRACRIVRFFPFTIELRMHCGVVFRFRFFSKPNRF
jgi:hypothetical protein